jgi:hypothetical protein
MRKEPSLPDGVATTGQPNGESRREAGMERQKFGRSKKDAPASARYTTRVAPVGSERIRGKP